jgi:hypothetical protein
MVALSPNVNVEQSTAMGLQGGERSGEAFQCPASAWSTTTIGSIAAQTNRPAFRRSLARVQGANGCIPERTGTIRHTDRQRYSFR